MLSNFSQYSPQESYQTARGICIIKALRFAAHWWF